MNEKRLQCELHKVAREIATHGNNYTFLRDKVDKYGETIDDEIETVCTANGIFHTSKIYVSKVAKDATTSHTKGSPMLLLRYSDSDGIKQNDYVFINNKKFKVVDVNDIQEYNIIVDISLDEVI